MKIDFLQEAKSSNPDFIVYIPKGGVSKGDLDTENVHFLVFFAPSGDMLATWTQSSYEGNPDQHIVISRSKDNGVTWSEPKTIVGPDKPGHIASWQNPIVSSTGRIYCFYHKNNGVVDLGPQFTGHMYCKYSDDDGETWELGVEIPLPHRLNADNPDPKIPPSWWPFGWQIPVQDSKGRWIIGITRLTSPGVRPALESSWENDCQIQLVRFENLDSGPHPKDLEFTWLPVSEEIRVPHPTEPKFSMAEEPTIILLPDKRLFMGMRTFTGRMWYTVSEDDGEHWRKPEVLRYEDNGDEVLQPLSPCPIYSLVDGRFLLVFHNNDGSANGGKRPQDYRVNRRPGFISLGEFRPQAKQPIWFSQPKVFCDNGAETRLGVLETTEIATYTSLTERDGRRILWYPDRKFFLLGKYITDEWLDQLKVP